MKRGSEIVLIVVLSKLKLVGKNISKNTICVILVVIIIKNLESIDIKACLLRLKRMIVIAIHVV
uniref:Candidate secreted effector n=1 Tax=Meloidogyne incognita TaxID=6306 RepID=A0A914MJT5_MELIC